MPPRKRDLAMDRYVKSMRAINLETKAATEYPDVREKLLTEVAELRAEVAALDKEIAKELRSVTKRLKDAATEYAAARSEFIRLHLGALAHDPGLTIYDGNRATATGAVREALLEVLNVEPVAEGKRVVSEQQELFEQRVRNERAGKGYLTDAQVAAGYQPLKDHGFGARLEKFPDLSGAKGGSN